MRKSSCLLILTIVWPLARSFDVSWFNVPNDDDMYNNRRENEIPQPNTRPDSHKPVRQQANPSYVIWTEDLYEENRLPQCAKIYCHERRCCQGECIYFFGSKVCIEMGRRKK